MMIMTKVEAMLIVFAFRPGARYAALTWNVNTPPHWSLVHHVGPKGWVTQAALAIVKLHTKEVG